VINALSLKRTRLSYATSGARRAAEEATEEMNQRIEEKEIERQIQEAKRKRRPYLLCLTVIFLVLLPIIVSLFFYFRAFMPGCEEFIPSKHLAVTTIILDQLIRDYSKDHERRVPQRLEQILGEHLLPEHIKPGDLEYFHYRRISPYSYELMPKRLEGELILDLVLTETGVQ